MKIETIKGTITTKDGVTREFSIGADGVWQQWGAYKEALGDTVDALDAMTRGLLEDDLLVSDADEDDEPTEDDETDEDADTIVDGE